MAETEDNLDQDSLGKRHPEIRPDIKPHLPSLERSGQDEGKSAGGVNPISGLGGGNTLSSGGLRSAEQNVGKMSGNLGHNLSGSKTEGLWRGKESGKSGSISSRSSEAIKGFVTGRPKLVGGGILGAIVVAIILLFSFGNIGAFELSTIANRDIDYQSEPEQAEEDTASRDLMAEEDCMQVEGGCPASQEEDVKPTDSQVSEAESNGETLTTDMENFKFTDPVVEGDLAKAGIQVDTSGTTFTGLSNSSGSVSPSDIENDTGGVFDDMEIGLPEWELGQTKEFPQLMYDEAGSDFDVFPDTQTDQPQQDIDDAVLDGAPDAPGVVDTSPESTEEPPNQNETPAQEAGAKDAGSASSKLVAAEDSVIEDMEKGVPESQAITDGADDFDLGSTGNLNVALQDLCMVDEVATEASIARVPEIMTLEIRHATTLESMFSQEQAGTITGKEVSTATSLYNGNQSALLPNSSLPKEDAEPFSASAEWQDAIGDAGSGTAIDSAALPTADEGTAIVNEVNGVLDDTGVGELGCDIEDSPFGTIANALGGVVTVTDDDATFGAGEIATLGAVGGIQTDIREQILPDIIKYFTPIAVAGEEDSVQWMNNTGAGLNMAYGNYSRDLGALPLSDAAADAEEAVAVADSTKEYNHESWTDRTLALSNPRSLISQLAVEIPIGRANIISGVEHYFSSLPSSLLHSLADIFSSPAHAQQPPSNPGSPYDTTQYGFTNGQVNEYGPIANEEYLFSNVSYGNKSMSRISMLGNPNSYTDNPSGDSDNNDLLHCFVDSYYTIETANPNFNSNEAPQNDPGADENCGVLGMYDYKDDPPTSTDTPNNQTVASIYCYSLAGSASDQDCINSLLESGQVNNDIEHFSQYLMDLHVMNNYTSLTNNQ